MNSIKAAWYVPIGMLILAVFPLPYGYFMLLRLVVTVAAAYVAYENFSKNIQNWGVVFVVIALLFNPFYTVHLDKALWAVIDLVAAGLFFINLNKKF
tara:strand:- start:541 stop:831 length:291 start_codon:yes stop_codon:yes gene_type:complete